MLREEEGVKAELIAKFDDLKEEVVIARQRRIFVEVPFERFRAVFDFAVGPLRFEMLYTITGLDDGAHFALLYHLGREGRVALNLRMRVPRTNPSVRTITDRFPAADLYERELADLFGIKVEGLPPGNRYPLPDDWPAGQYPLRKDWKGETPAGEGGDR